MTRELVERLYAALAVGDRAAVEELLHPDFVATFAAGMPFGIGGTYAGNDAIDHGWWAIGRAFDAHVEPLEFIPCTDGRMLVHGTYVGVARGSRRPLTAAYTHLISGDSEQLTRLIQVTDTAKWVAAAAG